MTARRVPFVTLDVFADRPFGGNPLAVVLDAAGLDPDRMQAIAAEFGYSETTFVLPPEDPAHTARVRIFTPRAEIPFAGHPNVGTAFALARLGTIHGRPVGDRVVFEEGAGLVPVDVTRDAAGAPVGAVLTAPRAIEVGAGPPADIVAACAGLAPEDVATGRRPPTVASVGLPFVLAELTGWEALARARPRAEAFEALSAHGTDGLHLYVRADDGFDLRTRMFAPLHGVAEDPATGSANAALAAFLAHTAGEADATFAFRIAQGVEMGRPSVLEAEAVKAGGRVTAVRVGGRCVPMTEGVFLTP